jgi:hypothetical protein
MSDLETNRPTYVIDTSPAKIHRWERYPLASAPRLQRFVAERYDRLDVLERVVIYRRRGCVTAPGLT